MNKILQKNQIKVIIIEKNKEFNSIIFFFKF